MPSSLAWAGVRECHPTSGLGAGCLRPDVEEICDRADNCHGERECGKPQRPSCAATAIGVERGRGSGTRGRPPPAHRGRRRSSRRASDPRPPAASGNSSVEDACVCRAGVRTGLTLIRDASGADLADGFSGGSLSLTVDAPDAKRSSTNSSTASGRAVAALARRASFQARPSSSSWRSRSARREETLAPIIGTSGLGANLGGDVPGDSTRRRGQI
jgi:hypothetical protein